MEHVKVGEGTVVAKDKGTLVVGDLVTREGDLGLVSPLSVTKAQHKINQRRFKKRAVVRYDRNGKIE